MLKTIVESILRMTGWKDFILSIPWVFSCEATDPYTTRSYVSRGVDLFYV